MAQQERRKERRWLLPFTTGVDISTIASALRLADAAGATLVAVSFLVTPGKQGSQGVRLERIQQSKDFLEAVRHKARRLAIPVECYEVFTRDLFASLETQLHDLVCECLVLASRGDQALLLHPHETQSLLLRPPVQLVCLRFPARATSGQPALVSRLLSWVKSLNQSGKRSVCEAISPGTLLGEPYEASGTVPYEKEA